MNIMRCRNAIFNLAGQFRKQVVDTGRQRPFCSKPQENKVELPPTAPAKTPHLGFKLTNRPSAMDRKILVWSGRCKTADEIPEFVSIEMLNAARTRMRVKVCYVMMAGTLAVCLVMVILGKRAVGRHESLSSQNMERKAQWSQEYQLQQQAAAAMPGKAQ